MYIVCMCRAHVFNSLSLCEMCTDCMENIQQSQGYNLKEVRQEISKINTEFLNFLHICITHMNAEISFLYEVHRHSYKKYVN